MKTNRNPLSLAILSAATSQHVGIAALSFAVDETTGWVQLLPAGYFSAVDGRPHEVPGGRWFIDGEIASRLISIAQSATNDLVVDYEHQTLHKDKNGQPAPAAGWFRTNMEWREGSGLWIKPEWTSRALEFIKNKEYRFISAVFPYDKKTGVPLFIHSAALTNRAGIDGMQELEALSATILSDQQLEKPAMNEAMLKLLAKLGIQLKEGETLTEEQETAVLSALDAVLTKAGKADELETQVATLSAQDNYDPSKYVPLDAFKELQKQVAVLSADSSETKLDTLIADAKKDGRLMACMEDWARDLGKKDMASLTAFLDNATPIAALSDQQTTETKPPEQENQTELTAEDLAVLSATGLDAEEFRKAKQELY